MNHGFSSERHRAQAQILVALAYSKATNGRVEPDDVDDFSRQHIPDVARRIHRGRKQVLRVA